MKKVKIILYIIIYSCVAWFLIKFCFLPMFHSVDSGSLSEEKRKLIRSKAEIEYGNLLNTNVQKELSIISAVVLAKKHPYIFYGWRERNCGLIVYKVNVPPEQNFTKLIHTEKLNGGITKGSFYGGTSGRYQFNYSYENDSLAREIHLGYSDSIIDSKKIGDSLLFFNLWSSGISLQFDDDESKDIVMILDKYTKNPRKEIDVCFYKKKQYCYAIIIFSQRNELSLERNILESILKLRSAPEQR